VQVKAFCLKLGMALTDDEVVEALGEIDSDGDGFVQFEEFAKWSDPRPARQALASHGAECRVNIRLSHQ
jgi:hypothetical protein